MMSNRYQNNWRLSWAWYVPRLSENDREMTRSIFRLLSFTYIGICIAIVSGSALQAVGKPFAALVLLLVRVGGVSLPAAFLFVHGLGMGIDGVFAGMGLGNVASLPISAVFTWWHLKRVEFRSVVAGQPEEDSVDRQGTEQSPSLT